MSAYTNIQYLLKNGYLNNEIIQQFAEDTVLYQVFEKDNKWVKAGAGQGQGAPLTYGMAWPIETQRNNSVGTFGVSSPNLLPGSTRSGVNAYTNLLASHASLLLDQFLFDAAEKGDTVFENVTERNMTTIFEDIQSMESRILWGTGNGQLGVVSAVNSGAYTITLDQSAAGRPMPVTRYTQPGTYVTILSSAGADRSVNGAQVSSCNDVTGTVTFPSSVNLGSVTAGDIIYAYQTGLAGSVPANVEQTGLAGIAGSATSTLFNVAPSTVNIWTPALTTTTNTDPTEQFLEQMRGTIATYGSEPDLVVSHPLVVSKAVVNMLQYKRIMSTDIPIGVDSYKDTQSSKGIKLVNGLTFIPDAQTPMGSSPNSAYLFMGKKSALFMGEAAPMHWMEEDQTILKQIVGSNSIASPSLAQFVGFLVHFWQTGCYKRRATAFATSVNLLSVV